MLLPLTTTILFIIFFLITLFLGKELLKKFRFLQYFGHDSHSLIIWNFAGDRKPGMYNIVLHGQAPFCALVGFQLTIPLLRYSGFDPFGFVRSDDTHRAVIVVYLGKAPRKFYFLINRDITTSPIEVTSSDEDQQLRVDARYSPHWWQRLGVGA